MTPDQKIETIHQTSLQILSEVGIKLHHSEVLELLKEQGIAVEGQYVFFTADQVRRWVNKAPSEFILYARNPENNLTIGGPKHLNAAGYGSSEIIDIGGIHRQSTLDDYIAFTRLIQSSPSIDFAGGITVQPNDIQNDYSHLAMLFAAIINSDKCLLGIPGSKKEITQIMEIGSILFGGMEPFKKKPSMLTLVSTLSPLQIDEKALATMLICAKYKQPMIISPGPLAGATGPISLAGNISMGNAEVLAGIIISQILSPGLPVLYGLQATTLDMKSGASVIGGPEFSLQSKYGAELARFYNLPSRGGGANSDAKDVSVQSGYEKMFSLYNTYLNRINLTIHVTGILDSYAAMSFEQFCIDEEIISMIEYYLSDIPVNTKSLSLDIIKQVGHGGQYLSHPDTFKKCRTEPWIPSIGLRGTGTKATPNQAYLDNIKKQLDSRLENFNKPKLDSKIHRQIRAYLSKCNLPEEVLNRISEEVPR